VGQGEVGWRFPKFKIRVRGRQVSCETVNWMKSQIAIRFCILKVVAAG
jgi:hypothetical protein